MRITSVRLGFATNSSSAHSIVEVHKPDEYEDEQNKNRFDHAWFLLKGDRKNDYIHQTIWDNLKNKYSEYCRVVAHFGMEPWDKERLERGWVDHQSLIGLPYKLHTDELDLEYLGKLIAEIQKPNVVIAGGSDNCAASTNVFGTIKWFWKYHGPLRSVRTGEDTWVIYDVSNGYRIEVDFSTADYQTKSSRVLSLLDVNITNYCAHNCPCCYRACTKQGKHAPLAAMMELVREARKSTIMEIVLGGGEPTDHPNFYPFLEDIQLGDLSISFTTRDYSMLHKLAARYDISIDEVIHTIKTKVKAIGVSVFTPEDVAEARSSYFRLNEAVLETDYHSTNIVYHYIPGGPHDKEVIPLFFEKDSFKFLLLGRKFMGREQGDEKKYGKAVRQLADMLTKHSKKIAIDTKMVQDFRQYAPGYMDRYHPQSYSSRECVNSMYLDLVGKPTVQECSYKGKKKALKEVTSAALTAAFDKFIPI